MRLPPPYRLSKRCSRWSGKEVLEAAREQGIELPEEIAGRMLSAEQLAAILGVHNITPWKWSRTSKAEAS